MRRAPLLAFLLALVLATGCAAVRPGRATFEHVHTDPPRMDVPNGKVVDQPFDAAWNELVRNISVTQFTITNVDKESRILTLDYEGEEGEPQKYVDCGRTRNTITYRGKPKVFEYATAESSYAEYMYDDSSNYHYWVEQNRHLSLAAKVNVYMAPLDDRQTEISVNASMKIYGRFGEKVYSYRQSGEYLHESDRTVPRKALATVLTKKPGSFPDGAATCVSTGVLERDVLDQVH